MSTGTEYAQNQRYLKLDPEAARLLDELAPSPRRRGRFVSNLILQEVARIEERRRLGTMIGIWRDGVGNAE